MTPIHLNLKSKFGNFAPRAGWLLLVVVAMVNVLLVHQNGRLVDQFGARAGDVVSQKLTDLSGLDIAGNPVRVQFEGNKKYVVFGFATACRFCDESFPKWNALSREVDRSRWAVVWVSRDSLARTQGHPAVKGLADLVLSEVPHRVYVQLGLAKVPRTVVVTAQGGIIGSHLGLLDDASVGNVRGLILGPGTVVGGVTAK